MEKPRQLRGTTRVLGARGGNYRAPAPRQARARGKTRADARKQLLSAFPVISQLDAASNAALDAHVPSASGSGVSF